MSLRININMSISKDGDIKIMADFQKTIRELAREAMNRLSGYDVGVDTVIEKESKQYSEHAPTEKKESRSRHTCCHDHSCDYDRN